MLVSREKLQIASGQINKKREPPNSMSAPTVNLTPGLYIVATPIGNLGDITLRALETLKAADAIACEDTRETGKLAQVYGISAPRIPYHDHNAAEMRPKIIERLKQGQSVALVSDAGMPLISDPGYKLVRACRDEGLSVTCIPGASASLAGLVLSGLPADRFFFGGFLPVKSAARRTALGDVAGVPATLVFYETAPRLAESLADMNAVLGARPAAVARELTKKFEEVRTGTLAELAAHYAAAGEPRGEIVVIVGQGDGTAMAWDAARIDARLAEVMHGQGLRVKDAAALVAAESGWRKNDVYARALLVKDGGG
ncbi:MAG: 16S rRNA (cytidine(1402)-2'-O)-methyltransferase [Alphaproteobacteria bacterium]|nr:16S rRNA (cytidine(1402)-2'-O)-methyltransferase [Alphaproteobacteria bacterium]